MTTRNASTSMGRGRGTFPCTPSQKQNLAVYTKVLTHPTVIFASVLGALLQNVLLSFASGPKIAVHTHVSTADYFSILISFDGFSP